MNCHVFSFSSLSYFGAFMYISWRKSCVYLYNPLCKYKAKRWKLELCAMPFVGVRKHYVSWMDGLHGLSLKLTYILLDIILRLILLGIKSLPYVGGIFLPYNCVGAIWFLCIEYMLLKLRESLVGCCFSILCLDKWQVSKEMLPKFCFTSPPLLIAEKEKILD